MRAILRVPFLAHGWDPREAQHIDALLTLRRSCVIRGLGYPSATTLSDQDRPTGRTCKSKSYVIHRVASERMCVVPSRPAVGSGRRACGRPLASHPIDGYGWVVVVCRYSERRGAVSSWSLARALYHITAAAGSHDDSWPATSTYATLRLLSEVSC